MKEKFTDKFLTKKRALVTMFIFYFLIIAIVVNLFRVMIIKGEEYYAIAEDQWTSSVKIQARRGAILDRNLKELAVSANVYRVDLDLKTIREYLEKNSLTYEDIASKIAEALEMNVEKVLKVLNTKDSKGNPAGSAYLIRRVEKQKVDKVKELNISGIIISPDTKRYYPNNSYLSHVLGSTDIDGKGLTGIELMYDEELTGVDGFRIVELDAKSRDLPYSISEYIDPIDGKNVVLTIDEKIQFFAEKAASQALIDNQAKAVSIIVMNPENGEILAMVNKLDFNPNTVRDEVSTYDELQQLWRNRSVNDIYEPGSIFKIVTAMAAIEEGLVSENDIFQCSGHKEVGGRVIHCWKRTGHGAQNFAEILQNSCNVGFMEIGERLGAETLNKYIEKFGFGQKTGVDLPGEAKGIIKKTENISTVDLATISFGQTNTTTPIQFLAAVNAVANDGVWVKPHLLKEVSYYDDEFNYIVDRKFEDYSERRVVGEESAAIMRELLEKVVSEGSAGRAFIEGYEIAGKTGTAQKVDPETGTYGAGKYISSFVGFAPASDPKVSIFISIDEPSAGEYYAGVITTPVARQLFSDLFNYLSIDISSSDDEVRKSLLKDVIIPEIRDLTVEDGQQLLKELNLEYETVGEGEKIVDITPKPGYSVKEGTKVVIYKGDSSQIDKQVLMPDLYGYSKQGAIEILESIGLKYKIVGEGLMVSQSIEVGKIVQRGDTVELTFSVKDIH